MAKNNQNIDIKNLSLQDLVSKVTVDKMELQKLRFNHATSPISNTNQIRADKKKIARLMTEINARKTKRS